MMNPPKETIYLIDNHINMGVEIYPNGVVNYSHRGSSVVSRGERSDVEIQTVLQRGERVSEEEFKRFVMGTNEEPKSVFEYVQQLLSKGERAYLIDDYDERAICFDASLPEGQVWVKRPHQEERCVAQSHPYVFESILSARRVSQAEYDAY